MSKPNFLIVGAMKSGTTSLWHYTRHNPTIYTPRDKELNYFNGSKRTRKEREAYFKQFDSGISYTLRGECSPRYLFDPNSAGRIYSELGENTKIIAILRNPIDRSFSHWKHTTRHGKENDTFSTCLRRFYEKREIDDILFAYIAASLYHQQLERYYRLFSRKNIKIIFLEEMLYNQNSVVNEIFSFLGAPYSKDVTTEVFNAAAHTKIHWIREFFEEENIFREKVGKYLPSKTKKMIKRFSEKIYSRPSEECLCDNSTRKVLKEIFSDDVERTSALINQDCSNYWVDFDKNQYHQ